MKRFGIIRAFGGRASLESKSVSGKDAINRHSERLAKESSNTNLIQLQGIKINSTETAQVSCQISKSDLRLAAKKVAFTLAEVLITLGIIGVVAAITLPTLIQNYKNQAYVDQLKKTVSSFENGIKLIIAKEGATSLTETELGKYIEDSSLSSDDLYTKIKPIFKNNFNIIETYSASEIDEKLPNSTSGVITNVEVCKSYIGKVKAIAYKQTNKNQCISIGGASINFSLADGAFVEFEKYVINPVDNNEDAKKIVAAVLFDINGLKGPNQYGYDVFQFLLIDDGSLIPAGGIVYAKTSGGENNWKRYYWATGSGMTCKVKGKSYSGWGTGCAASVVENGWKIDY